MNTQQQKLYHLLETLPHGKITTYARLAEQLGNKKLARAVGKWLSCYPYWKTGNCYRVVRSDGFLGGYRGSEDENMVQKKRIKLEELGCVFDSHNRIVNMNDFL